MTTDELERDLKTLAEAQPDDEHLRLAIRGRLGDQLNAPPTRRRRTRLLLGVGGIAAATGAAALVALVGTGGPSSANAAILAHVASAVTPPANLIVHVKETGTLPEGTQVGAEWWQETNAPYALRLIKGPLGQENEGGGDGTTAYQYDASTNTIYEQPDSKAPSLVDPIETARAALANGTAQVDGTVTIDGQALYKIDLSDGVIGYFDRTDYRPVYIDNPQRDGGSVVRTKVLTYEELPNTAQNEKLVSITAQHPGARVVQGAPPAPTKSPTESK